MCALGKNAGEAFGQAGIGVYGKRFLRKYKGGSLTVEFRYRSSRQQKKVQVVRLPVVKESVSAVDGVIREWLRNKLTKTQTDVLVNIDTLMGRELDYSVFVTDYLQFQNCKTKKRRRGGQTLDQDSRYSPPVCVRKLATARYKLHKRQTRMADKVQKQKEVCFYVHS